MYLHTYFNASDLKLEELPALVVLTMVLGAMGTTRHSSEELQMLVKQKIGSLSFQPIVLPGSDADHCRVMASAFMACLSDQGESAVTLLREILTETDFNDRKLLRDMLNQSAMGAQMALSANGHQYAITRVGAYNTAHGVAKEYTGGAELAMWFKKISTADDAALDKLLADMERIARQVFTAERLTVSCSEKVTDELLDELIFPAGEKAPAEASYTPLGKRQEGLLIPAAVGFAGKGTSLKRHGKVFNGCIPVLTNVLNFVYLWSEIRVQGGAYGCGFIGRDDGDVGFYTYRDPQPGRSLDVMNQAAAFIRGFCADEPDLTGFILSAVSTLDPLLNTESKMTVAENRYFKGTSYEDVCRCLRADPNYLSEEHSINYVECHDDYTFYDRMLIYKSEDEKAINRRRARLAMGLVMIAKGIPFIHSGEEFLRSKNGTKNSYNSGDLINRFNWDRRELMDDTVRYLKELIAIRQKYDCFCDEQAFIGFESYYGALIYRIDNLTIFINPGSEDILYDDGFERRIIFADERIRDSRGTLVDVSPYSIVICENE